MKPSEIATGPLSQVGIALFGWHAPWVEEPRMGRKFGHHERLRVSKTPHVSESAGEVHQPTRRAEASCSASRRRARISGSTRTLPNTTYRTAAAGESVGRLSISNCAIC